MFACIMFSVPIRVTRHSPRTSVYVNYPSPPLTSASAPLRRASDEQWTLVELVLDELLLLLAAQLSPQTTIR